MEDEPLSANAKAMLAIMRAAAKKKQFPRPFTQEVLQTLLEALELSDQEFQIVTEILRADIRESSR